MSCTTVSSSGLSQMVRKCWPFTFTRCDYDLCRSTVIHLSLGRGTEMSLALRNSIRWSMGGQGQADRIAQSKYFAAKSCRLSRSTDCPHAADLLLSKLPLRARYV